MVSREIENTSGLREILVHTGQHYDNNMSEIFFRDLDMRRPDYFLGVGGGSHGQNTGRMLEAIEKVLTKEKPDWVVVYGDTDSTLAGALAAAKLGIPIAHVEAGLRSFNRKMPEEINRILTDHISNLLFCPTKTAEENLRNEGLESGVLNVGDVMLDAARIYGSQSLSRTYILKKLKLKEKTYALATCHRAENTNNPTILKEILSAFRKINKNLVPVVLPLHPRTKQKIKESNLDKYLSELIVTEPVSFLEMICLEKMAKVILTDSGGVQREAFFYNIPCVVLRKETEWKETILKNSNRLSGTNANNIYKQAIIKTKEKLQKKPNKSFGNGNSAKKIIRFLLLFSKKDLV